MDLELQKFVIESLKRTLKRDPTQTEIDERYANMEAVFKNSRKAIIEALEPLAKDMQNYSDKVERDASTIDRMHYFKPDKKHFWSFVSQNFTHDEMDEMAFNDPAPAILKYIERYKKQINAEYKVRNELTYRQKAIIEHFKAVENEAAIMTRAEAQGIAKNFEKKLDSVNYWIKSSKFKEITNAEIESILPYLEGFPHALKLAKQRLS